MVIKKVRVLNLLLVTQVELTGYMVLLLLEEMVVLDYLMVVLEPMLEQKDFASTQVELFM